MSNWITPKTCWQPQDTFCLDPDYQRIRQDLLWLARRGAAIYALPPLPPLAQPTIQDVPDADFFNHVEQALGCLSARSPRPIQPPPPLHAGDPVWNWRDLSRIEQALQALYHEYQQTQTAQPMLAFTLGGDLF